MDAVKAMQASLRVPKPENLRHVKVKPERLAKIIEVEGDGSKIEEQVRRFQEFKFQQVYLTIAKVVKQLCLGRTPAGTPMTADKGWNSLFAMVRC